jgi:mono/diheme cytochrome c family protein
MLHDENHTMNRHYEITHNSRFRSATLILASLILLGGCRSELYDQEYGEPLEESEFFADKRMARPLVEGTVARGHLNEDELMYAGKNSSGEMSVEFPMELTRELIDRGQERFNIYCSPCHGSTGRGDGIIVQRGMKRPPSYHEQRLVEMPAGYFFDVITNGFGMMYSYASRVKPEDRWAIVAYIRALQKMEPTIPTPDLGDSIATAAASTPVVDRASDTMVSDRLRLQDSNR